MKRFATVLLLVLAAFCARAGEVQWAIVRTSTCFVRNAPDYEAGLDTQCRMGDVVQILDSDRYWRKVSTPDPYVGWTAELCLAPVSEEEKDRWIAAPKWICTADFSHIYAGPSGSEPVCDFTRGNLVLQVPGECRAGRVKVLLPDGAEGWAEPSDIADYRQWAESRECTAQNVIATARGYLGVPYMWGGISPKHFDCSGLVKFSYWMNGVLLPRDSSQMILLGEEVPADFSLMQPGDLVFFGRKASGGKPRKPSHVALYIGGGRIIHSSQLVRINSLVEGEADCYDKEIIAVRRILGHIGSGGGAHSLLSDPMYFVQDYGN